MSTSDQYSKIISFVDNVNIRNIASMYAAITDSFQSSDSIVIDISENAEADLSFVQLIESARRHAKDQAKSIALAAPASGQVLKVLERAGFLEAFNPDDTKFWLHEEVTQ